MTYSFIGGKADGQLLEVPRGTITFGAHGDSYIALDVREKGQKEPELFFMLAGGVPAEAVSIYRKWHSPQNSGKPSLTK